MFGGERSPGPPLWSRYWLYSVIIYSRKSRRWVNRFRKWYHYQTKFPYYFMLANFVVNFLNTSLFTKLLLLKTSQNLGGKKHCWPPPKRKFGGASDPRFYRQRTPCLHLYIHFQFSQNFLERSLNDAHINVFLSYSFILHTTPVCVPEMWPCIHETRRYRVSCIVYRVYTYIHEIL